MATDEADGAADLPGATGTDAPSVTGDRPYRIAVIGAATATERQYRTARELGSALAGKGAIVVCGGRGGVMEAAARGAREAGGMAVGILPGPDASEANEWISLPLATGMGEARNALVVRGGEAVVAVGGGWGTLSEIALAGKMGRAVTLLDDPPVAGLGLHASADAVSAAEWAIEAARVYRSTTE